MRKKTYRFCNARKWKDFNKKQLTLLKMCVTSLLWGPRVDLWPFYGCLSKRFIFVGYRNDRFFPIQILIFWMLRNNVDDRRYSYFELGLPVIILGKLYVHSRRKTAIRLTQFIGGFLARQWQLPSYALVSSWFMTTLFA